MIDLDDVITYLSHIVGEVDDKVIFLKGMKKDKPKATVSDLKGTIVLVRSGPGDILDPKVYNIGEHKSLLDWFNKEIITHVNEQCVLVGYTYFYQDRDPQTNTWHDANNDSHRVDCDEYEMITLFYNGGSKFALKLYK